MDFNSGSAMITEEKCRIVSDGDNVISIQGQEPVLADFVLNIFPTLKDTTTWPRTSGEKMKISKRIPILRRHSTTWENFTC